MSKYIWIIIVIIVYFIGYYTSAKREKITRTSLIAIQKKEIESINKNYQKELFYYKQQISTIQQNNIYTYKTIYKPTGEKIVTKVIDKSVVKNTEQKRATVQSEDLLIEKSRYKEDNSKIYRQETSSSIPNYKLGIMGLQSTGVINLTDLKINGGVRIFSLPIFITFQAPPLINFYKNLEFGLEIEFSL